MKKAYVRFHSYLKDGEDVVLKTTRKDAKRLCKDFSDWFGCYGKGRVSWIKDKTSNLTINNVQSYNDVITMLSPMWFRINKMRMTK